MCAALQLLLIDPFSTVHTCDVHVCGDVINFDLFSVVLDLED